MGGSFLRAFWGCCFCFFSLRFLSKSKFVVVNQGVANEGFLEFFGHRIKHPLGRRPEKVETVCFKGIESNIWIVMIFDYNICVCRLICISSNFPSSC